MTPDSSRTTKKSSFAWRWLKRLALAFAVFVILIIVWAFIANDPRPQGTAGEAADALARRMMTAVGHQAWQRTGAVRWNFGGRQQHLWDRQRQFDRVRWGDHEVLIDLDQRTGVATRGGEPVAASDHEALVAEAWAHWANDSFWLNPVAKLFDGGTRRELVEQQDGSQALLVTYEEGGATPGDAYLWIPGEDGLPVRWRMWVSIIPIGGIGTSWEDWITLDTGARVATRHKIGVIPLELTDVAGAATLAELEPGPDPFAALAGEG